MSSRLTPYSPQAWYRAIKRIASHRLFRAMAMRQGVDVLGECRPETEAELFRAMRTCVACPHLDACRIWLEMPCARDPFPSFCPNARYWEAHRQNGSPARSPGEWASGR
jgi:hypothetical protein